MARLLDAVARYRAGRLSCVQAAELLGMSERHLRRLRDRHEARRRRADRSSARPGVGPACAGLTAYHALHRRLHVRAGQSILVHAGAGGVGSFAIQLAAHAGLKVLTTCSANNAEYVHNLGAEVAIDYHTENLKEVVRAATEGQGVDAILSSLGSERATQDLDLLAFNGGLACLLGLPDLTRLQPFTIAPSIHEVALGSAHRSGDKRAQEDPARMADELAALIIRGAVHLPPIEVIPWQEIPAGLDRLANGHVCGKIVAQVRMN